MMVDLYECLENTDELKQKISTVKFINSMVLPCCHSRCLLYCDTYFRIKFIRHFDDFDLIHLLITYLLQRTGEFCKRTERRNMTAQLLQDTLNAYAEYVIEAGFAQNVILQGLWPRASITVSYQHRLFNGLRRHDMPWE